MASVSCEGAGPGTSAPSGVAGSERSSIVSCRRGMLLPDSEPFLSGLKFAAMSESLRNEDDSSAVCSLTPEEEYCTGSVKCQRLENVFRLRGTVPVDACPATLWMYERAGRLKEDESAGPDADERLALDGALSSRLARSPVLRTSSST